MIICLARYVFHVCINIFDAYSILFALKSQQKVLLDVSLLKSAKMQGMFVIFVLKYCTDGSLLSNYYTGLNLEHIDWPQGALLCVECMNGCDAAAGGRRERGRAGCGLTVSL